MLSEALAAMQIPKEPQFSNASLRSYNLRHKDEWQLYDLLVLCRRTWLTGCKRIQTQFTQNHKAAARWNALWQRVKFLFKKRGVTL